MENTARPAARKAVVPRLETAALALSHGGARALGVVARSMDALARVRGPGSLRQPEAAWSARAKQALPTRCAQSLASGEQGIRTLGRLPYT